MYNWFALFWVVTQRVVVNPYWRFVTSYWSHLQGFKNLQPKRAQISTCGPQPARNNRCGPLPQKRWTSMFRGDLLPGIFEYSKCRKSGLVLRLFMSEFMMQGCDLTPQAVSKIWRHSAWAGCTDIVPPFLCGSHQQAGKFSIFVSDWTSLRHHACGEPSVGSAWQDGGEIVPCKLII